MIKEKTLHFVFRYFGNSSLLTRKLWARVLSALVPLLMRKRVYIVQRNLELAFPNLSQQQRQAIQKKHFRLLTQSIVDRGLLWFGSREKVLQTTPIKGLENIGELLELQKPIILLAPHFIGLDAAATRLTIYLRESATMYTSQSDPVVDNMVREGRGRFNTVHLVNRKQGIRPLLRYLRKGTPVYYLPDMDFGRQGACFVPFFGVPAATLLATAQLARNWNASLVPIVSKLDHSTGKYHIEVLPAIENFPGEQTNEEATARLNKLIESWVEPDPAQYYWVHRRYKTRPNPEDKKLYQYKPLFKRNS